MSEPITDLSGLTAALDKRRHAGTYEPPSPITCAAPSHGAGKACGGCGQSFPTWKALAGHIIQATRRR